jgi:amino acid permease
MKNPKTASWASDERPFTASESIDMEHGSYRIARDYGADTDLKRVLTTRHVTMIALGSSIGMGLWLGAGKSLAAGGPAAIFLGFLLAGSMSWAVTHSIGEMSIMYPLPSAFVQWVRYPTSRMVGGS